MRTIKCGVCGSDRIRVRKAVNPPLGMSPEAMEMFCEACEARFLRHTPTAKAKGADWYANAATDFLCPKCHVRPNWQAGHTNDSEVVHRYSCPKCGLRTVAVSDFAIALDMWQRGVYEAKPGASPPADRPWTEAELRDLRASNAEASATKSALTREEFIAGYCERSKITQQWLAERGRFAAPCDCGEKGCQGWAMRSVELLLMNPKLWSEEERRSILALARMEEERR